MSQKNKQNKQKYQAALKTSILLCEWNNQDMNPDLYRVSPEVRADLRALIEYRALPSSQEAMSKAEAKRQRKSAKLLKQFGNE